MRLNLMRRDAALALVAFALVAIYGVAGGGGFPLDDGWIHQTYARNLAERAEWSFVPGEPSAASTSPLWTALLVPFHFLGPVPGALLLGGVALAAAGIFGARLADGLFPDVPRAGWAAGIGVIAEWHLIWAAGSGMETALFGALTLLAMMGFARDQRLPRHGAAFGAIGGLLLLTRPEGVGILGLAALLTLPELDRENAKGRIAWGLGVLAGFGPFAAAYAALNLALGGEVLPSTAAAKTAEYAPLLALPYTARLVRVTVPLMAGALTPLLPGIAWGMWNLARARNWRGLLPAAWAIGLIALYAARLPVDYQHGRYVIPAIPGLIVIGTGGTLDLVRRGRRSMARRILSRTALIVSVLVLIIFALALGPGIYARDVAFIDSRMVAAAKWLAENVPPEERLAVHDIGAVGYFAPRPILDLAGLVSPEVIPIIRDEAALRAYRAERGADYFMTLQSWYATLPDATMTPVWAGGDPADGGDTMVIYRIE